jgi:hypothetical protein
MEHSAKAQQDSMYGMESEICIDFACQLVGPWHLMLYLQSPDICYLYVLSSTPDPT